jgi:hypothetical protein
VKKVRIEKDLAPGFQVQRVFRKTVGSQYIESQMIRNLGG